MSGGLRQARNLTRDKEIAALQQDGVGVDDIAARYSLSRRSVFRVLAGAKA